MKLIPGTGGHAAEAALFGSRTDAATAACPVRTLNTVLSLLFAMCPLNRAILGPALPDLSANLNRRIDDLRGEMHREFQAMESKLHRVEEVFDARLKLIEDRLGIR
jgi:hypothetical protein